MKRFCVLLTLSLTLAAAARSPAAELNLLADWPEGWSASWSRNVDVTKESES